MDAETERQIAELEQQQEAHRRRLQVLEVQAANYGRDAAPHIVTEIAEIKSKLVPIDSAIIKLTYHGTIRADIPGNDRGDTQGIAIERALERQRRYLVAQASIAEAARDEHIKTAIAVIEARMTTAIEAIKHALTIIGSIAALALILAIVLSTVIWLRQ